MFALTSDITIGSFHFSGVNEVQVSRSLHSIVETAIIRLPSMARIIKNGKVIPGNIITGKQFKEGDPVTIKLGYNSQLQIEFSGFVTRCNLDMPLTVECEGYSWLLRKNNIADFYSTIKVKDLLLKAVSGIDPNYKINVQCEVDVELSNVAVNNLSGFSIINDLMKYTDGCLSCFFIRPDTLWCGMVYTPCINGTDSFNLGLVNYKPGYNVLKENGLKVRDTNTDPVKVTYTKKGADGNIISGISDLFPDAKREYNKILNHINDASVLYPLANEKAHRINYTGYEGSVNTFLQPYAAPGYLAYIEDARYPERKGQYLVESTRVTYGINGARRAVEVGPLLGGAKQ